MMDRTEVATVGFLQAVRGFSTKGIPSFFEFAKKVGNRFRIRFLNSEIYVTSHPEDAKEILQTKSRIFIKGATINPLRKILGNTILTNDNEAWLLRRRIEQPSFQKNEEKRCLDAVSNSVKVMIKPWIGTFVEFSHAINIFEHIKINSLQLSLQTLLGTNLDGMQSQLRVNLLKSLLPGMWDIAGQRLVRSNFAPIFIPTKANRMFKESYKEFSKMVKELIAEKRKTKNYGKDVLSKLLLDQEKSGLSEEGIVKEIFTYYIASYGANAGVLGWVITHIAQNPQIEHKLRQEITTKIHNSNLSLEDLSSCTYTSQVIMETMRLMPPAYIAARKANESTTIGDYSITKGSIILVDIYSLHRNPHFWINPETFDPERFAPQNLKNLHRYSFLPFGLGPRQCISKNFNMIEMQTVLITLLREFEIRLDASHPLPKPVFDLAVTPRAGVFINIRANRAKNFQKLSSMSDQTARSELLY